MTSKMYDRYGMIIDWISFQTMIRTQNSEISVCIGTAGKMAVVAKLKLRTAGSLLDLVSGYSRYDAVWIDSVQAQDVRAQTTRGSRGGRPGLPVPDSDSLYDLGGRKAMPTKKKKRKMYDKELSDMLAWTKCVSATKRNASVPPE